MSFFLSTRCFSCPSHYFPSFSPFQSFPSPVVYNWQLVLDPKPTCGVASTGPIPQGQNVTLACTMTYHYQSTLGRRPYQWRRPRATISASIGWQSEAGTVRSYPPVNLEDGGGVTLRADARILASGTEIPSYSCTAQFDFSDDESSDTANLKLAVNSVSWTCVSEAVKIWSESTFQTIV